MIEHGTKSVTSSTCSPLPPHLVSIPFSFSATFPPVTVLACQNVNYNRGHNQLCFTSFHSITALFSSPRFLKMHQNSSKILFDSFTTLFVLEPYLGPRLTLELRTIDGSFFLSGNLLRIKKTCFVCYFY